MKKHPVDDLFKRKLSGLDTQPSSEAWLKIAKETKSKPSAAAWVWYAAASIIVALLAGYAVWENNGTEPGPAQLASNVAPAHKDQPALADLVEKDTLLVGKAESKKETTIAAEKIAKRQTGQDFRIAQENIVDDKKVNSSQKEVFAADLKEIPASDIDQKTEEINPLSVKAIADIPLKKESVEIHDEIEPSRTVVVVIETDDNRVESKPKTSRFSKVFRQLKNVRAGERVDWDEVGFDPKELVARVDDRLRNGEEKVSEKYHNIKEKTKL